MMRKHVVYISILFVAIIIAYIPFVFAPDGIKQTDSITFGVYANAVVKYNLLNYGQIGLWDNVLGLGQPLIGHLNAIFYPLNFITLLISNQIIAYKIVILMHLLLAGVAVYFLMVFFGCRKYLSLLGGVFYCINFPTESIVNLGLTNEIINLYLLPLIILFIWIALFKGKKHYAIFSGVLLAFHVLAITLYVVYFSGIVLLFIFIFYLIKSLSSKRNFIRSIKSSITVGVTILAVGIGLSAIKLLPILHYSALAMRQDLPLYGPGNPLSPSWEALTIHDTIKHIFYFLIPSGQQFLSKYLLINFLFFVLILVSFFSKSKKVYFFIFLTVVSMWAALGNRYGLDLYSLFYYFFPGFKTIEHQNRFYIIANLTLPMIAVFGANTIVDLLKKNAIKIIFIFFLLAVSLLSCISFVYLQLYRVYYRDEVLAIKSQKTEDFNRDLNKLSKTKEIFHIESLYNEYTNRFRQVFSYTAYLNKFRLTNQYLRDFSLTYEYAPLSRVVMTYKNGLVENKSIERLYVNNFVDKKYKFLSLMNTKYVLMDKLENDYPNKYIIPVLSHYDGMLYKMNSYMSYVKEIKDPILLVGNNDLNDFDSFKARYIFLNTNLDISNYSIFTSTKKFLDDYNLPELNNFKELILADPKIKNKRYVNQLLKNYLLKGGKVLSLDFKKHFYADIRYRSMSIVTKKPAEYLTSEQTGKINVFLRSISSDNTSESTIATKKNTPEDFIFSVDTKKETNAFRIADTFYPGWNVFIDGKKSNVFMADGILKGIIVKGSGRHIVELKFQPTDFYFGAIISILTLVLIFPSFKFLKRISSNNVS